MVLCVAIKAPKSIRGPDNYKEAEKWWWQICHSGLVLIIVFFVLIAAMFLVISRQFDRLRMGIGFGICVSSSWLLKLTTTQSHASQIKFVILGDKV